MLSDVNIFTPRPMLNAIKQYTSIFKGMRNETLTCSETVGR